jgi:hypothetical protein
MTILGHKITNIQMTIQICIWGTYKYLLWCLESKIWVLCFQMCDLRIFGLFVAFLVFIALKVKLKTLPEFSKPFDHIIAKKYLKNHFFAIWSLKWPSKFFFGLSHFFWDISCLRSPLGCSNPISKFNIIPNSKWFKFPISNHSAETLRPRGNS